MSRNKDLDFPNQIRRYRRKRGLRLRDVARKCGVCDGTLVWYWETGKRIPTLDNALKLSAAIQCPLEILYLDRFREIKRDMDELGKCKNHKITNSACADN